ncbi:ATP-binding protein [Uliginosibacterium sp. H3]|uniref:ATP-binding protein n=1 Tax=Uliginosibacterium silvisoli TaxID=3114758 RepID=A0ABU6K8Z9_9RHOO|nr:ATP-binding protein [Uliginosibacterium sp. H3]
MNSSAAFPAAHADAIGEVSPPPSSVPTQGGRIRHRRIGALIDDVGLLLDGGKSSTLLLVCGPAGAGKSTLGKYLVEAELVAQRAEMVTDPGFLPAIRVEAPASGEKEFSWRLLYERILSALEGDLDAPRTTYGVDPRTGRVVGGPVPQPNRLGGLRTAVERTLRQRRTQFIVLDEFAHVMNQCPPNRHLAQLDTLKSLSNECGVQWVLLGSYDLFNLLSLSGQIARRTHVLHFSRYREDDEADVQTFRSCVAKFAETLPALAAVDLPAYAHILHANTLGCIGTLRDILVRLSIMVAARGWSTEVFHAALMSDAQVQQILQEVTDGEERIAPGLKHSRAGGPSTAHRRIA